MHLNPGCFAFVSDLTGADAALEFTTRYISAVVLAAVIAVPAFHIVSRYLRLTAILGTARVCTAVILPFIVLNLHLVVHWKEIIDKIRCPNCILFAAFFTAEFLYRPSGLLATVGTIPAQNVRSHL
jgi:hypothetical protein